MPVLRHGAIHENHTSESLAAEHVHILERLDRSQGPADKHNISQRLKKIVQVSGATFRGVAEARNLRLALATRIQSERVIAAPQFLYLS